MNWDRNRKITERWFIEGVLELATPTSLSNGDDDPLVDLPIVVDALEGRALLTGASLAGALRAYLVDFDPDYAMALFGGMRGDPEGAQSSLIVEDALGDKPIIELRDGVSIDPATRTAKEKERYDRQLLAAGTTFGLGFELILTERDDAATVKAALAQALHGLQAGDIRLGGRKRRGYGQCAVTAWRAWRYDLGEPESFKGWLAHGRQMPVDNQKAPWDWTPTTGGGGILDWPALAGVDKMTRADELFSLSADFAIDGAVLIRHGFEAETGPDVSHLRSRRDGKDVPVMSGTSLAGVIRAQALRIARTMAGGDEAGNKRADGLVRGMFGYMQKPEELPRAKDGRRPDRRKLRKHAGRVTIDESTIAGQTDLVQTRVKIDRFTGGAFESALFAEQPAFGGGFTLKLALREPADAEVGLLLLVLKDLWTGFLPVGGSSSVGRGRLKGARAAVGYGGKEWTLEAAGKAGESVKVSSATGAAATKLNDYVTAFKDMMEGKTQ